MPEFTLTANGRDRTLSLRVKPGRSKPYLYKGKAYRRADTSTVEVDKVELGRLVLEGSNMTFDRLPSGALDSCFQVLGKHLSERLGVDAVDDNVLGSLGLLDFDGSVTNAGALLADGNSFPGIDLVRFGATSREIIDRETLAGISVLEQYERAAGFFSKYYIYELIQGMARDEVQRVPEEAFREAIANALVHRTWDVNANITVSMYDDRVEIVSPGPLPPGLTEGDYLAGHISVLRNPVLAGVFFRLGYIEQFGTGIPRIRELYKDSPVKPSFVVRPSSISVVLPTPMAPDLASDEASIWGALDGGVCMTRSELGSVTGFSKDKTIRMLNRLISKHLVVREGKGPGTRYSWA